MKFVYSNYSKNRKYIMFLIYYCQNKILQKKGNQIIASKNIKLIIIKNIN